MAEGFDFVLVAAAKFTSLPAVVDRTSGRVVTFTELEKWTRDRAIGLLARGAKTIATYAPTSLEHVLVVLAGLRAGVTVFPISTRLPEMRAKELAKMAGADWLEIGNELTGAMGAFRNDLAAPATLLATSGSSGEPKRVVHSLGGHLANARGSFSKLPLRPGCGWLLNLPLYHVSGLSVLFRCMSDGAVMVLPKPDEFETAILDERVTHLSVVSTQLGRLLRNNIELGHLKAILAGGGPIPVADVNAAIRRGWAIHLTYGMTETGSQITTTRRLKKEAECFSSGTVNAELQVRIGADNEIQIKGQAVCLGRIGGGGELESGRTDDGWFRTRDLGFLDQQGELWVTGRADRQFISGGENVQPELIEQALQGMEEVRRAVVMPMADGEFGNRPVAFVAWNELGCEERVRGKLLTQLPKFMLPVRFESWPEEAALDRAKIELSVFKERVRQIDAGHRGSFS